MSNIKDFLNEKTDLERSVSLLTPHCPSDHAQAVVQRPPFISLLSNYVVLAAPLRHVSRRRDADSLTQTRPLIILCLDRCCSANVRFQHLDKRLNGGLLNLGAAWL